MLIISGLSLRFEFDLSLDEAKHRTLCVCVKNNAASFMSRDKDVVGQVRVSASVCVSVHECVWLCSHFGHSNIHVLLYC